MDLRRWIVTDHDATADRFQHAIGAHVPPERWTERADGGGASIAWLLFHLSYHQDLAVNTAARGRPPLLAAHRRDLGLSDAAPHDGLGEAEQPDLTAALRLDRLAAYAADVHATTAAHLREVDLGRFEAPAQLAGMGELSGVTDTAVPWLYRLWSDKTVGWLVQWEAIGHVHGHVAEMISVRGRLGLSPF